MEVNTQVSDARAVNETGLTGKRPRDEETYAFPAKLKGVVSQRKGHWAAEIYVNSHIIWLGTFGSEEEAATAYDSTAIKIQRGEFLVNYPWTEPKSQEPECKTQCSEEALFNMIRDRSSQSKFSYFLWRQTQNGKIQEEPNLTAMGGNEKFRCRQLFHKVLTPSDVGKLNRLVIPIKYALKYFPCIQESQDCVEGGKQSDMQLAFYDRLMKSWNFRYCYWRSSQSFVFTRGWNRFVKEKELQAKDIVFFYECQSTEKETAGQSFPLIDVCYHQDEEYYSHMVDYVEEDKKILSQKNMERCIKKSKVALLGEKAEEDNRNVMLFGVKID